MKIPLPKMMRHWREREFEKHLSPRATRWGLAFWAFFASRPRLYRLGSRLALSVLRLYAGRRGSVGSLPFAGGWTQFRDMPMPQGRSFMAQIGSRKR